MEDSFTIPINYKREDREFEAKLLSYGYSYKIHVDIDDVGVLFEPDEERQFRAVLDEESNEKNANPNVELIQLVASTIAKIVAIS